MISLVCYRWGLLFIFLVLIDACGMLSTGTSPYPPPREQPSSAVAYPVAPQGVTISIPTVVVPPEPPTDFAFSFHYGACGTDILDGFQHTFTKDMIAPGEPSVTIPFSLTSTELTTIYHKMVAVNFFGYPAMYDTSMLVDPTHAIVTPASRYRFRVQQGGQIKTVAWSDNVVPRPTVDAERLHDVAQLIIQILQVHPEIQHLPEPKAACL